MLVLTDNGLYCPAGNFYIDPSKGVEHAVITHAHADHARRGSEHYYCVSSGAALLKSRLGQNIQVTPLAYGETRFFGEVVVSYHPAGHILGSSQVRVEFNKEVWVASGDYKRDPDPTCEPFESVECDVFITEATFGTPAYAWDKNKNHGQDILAWWERNKADGFNSVLFAYSLGKAQRILGYLAANNIQTVYCHPATEKLNRCYQEAGVSLANTTCLSTLLENQTLAGELILTPSSFLKSEQAQCLGRRYKTAFASGWMAQKHHGYDAGFALSDHADWHDLIRTILASKARHVFVQHRGHGALVRELKSLGLKAQPIEALRPKNPKQLAFL